MAIKSNILITGGSGFFGSLLKEDLLRRRYNCVNIDLERDSFKHKNLISIQGDIRNKNLLLEVFSKNKFSAIYHCAAILAHAVKDKNFLWTSNVNGTRNIADFAKEFGVKKVVFTSSNCLWGNPFNRLVSEEDLPNPVEIYGRSKLEGEKILMSNKKYFNAVIIRCPTIMDEGRLGLLAILFDFIDEGKKVWVVGNGENKYQFIYAKDLIDACIKSLNYNKSEIFNIGSDNVKSFKEVYNNVLKKAKTGSKIGYLPKSPAILLMKLAHHFKISPLGPYQYKMIAESFVFDTSKIKRELKWSPTLTNDEMLYKAYLYYHNNKADILSRKNVSAHKKQADMGIIRILRWVS